MTEIGDRECGQLRLALDLAIGADDGQLVSGSGGGGAAGRVWDATLQPSSVAIARFRRRIVITPSCHWWTGSISVPDGYGVVTFAHGARTRTMSTHRFALWLAGVDLAEGIVGEHGCDETLCVRVHSRHLRVATQADNLAHAVDLGRHRGPRPGDVDPRGRVGRALAIRAALREGYDPDRLADAMAWPAATAGMTPLF